MSYGKASYYSAPVATASSSTSTSTEIRGAAGRSSLPKLYLCEVCLNKTSESLLQSTGKCNHHICRICVRPYFNDALKDPRYTSYATIECPGHCCKQVFTITDAFLAKFFTKTEIDTWWSAALEKTFIKNKVRCPMSNCNGVFDAEEDDLKKCTFSECYECHRGFCMACQEPWHITEAEKANASNDKTAKELENDILMLNYADKSGWIRCPSCSYIVEKREGCRNMICHCGVTFCYYCGGRSSYDGNCICNNATKKSEARRKMFAQSTIKT